ncbi:transcriptional regulator, LysR family [Ruegeria halocynthiae]|uniref:Transcriptional regulator, LysR family n=1 Tax=Ruegeria halocynthiae TaxID=985054 RepID=A0A1H2YIR7_9RHOB|nr:LysR family transcriptional regulator [Ruegeria halocynthiae]SDX04449.1 transcriptional regulator, LysR family [Ruegeria halocynthiae]
MNWDDIRVLLAVARSGQLLAASTRLGITQATASRRIARLEEALSVPLLIRQSNGCALTEECERMMPIFEVIEARFAEVTAIATNQKLEIEGIVRLAVPDAFSQYFMPEVLRELAQSFPHLEVQLVPLGRNLSLSKRDADIAIMVGRPSQDTLICRNLAEYSLHLYASKSYLQDFPAPETLDDLSQHRLVGFVDDMLATPSMNYSQEVFGKYRPTIRISSAVTQVQAVRAGTGIGILHDFAARQFDDLSLVLPDERIRREYWIVWHDQDPLPMRIRATIDALSAHAKAKSRDFWTSDAS